MKQLLWVAYFLAIALVGVAAFIVAGCSVGGVELAVDTVMQCQPHPETGPDGRLAEDC